MPWVRFCYGGICHAFDMRTTQMIFAGPEQAIFGASMTQMGKHYGLPVYVNVGLTDAKRPDAQAGLDEGSKNMEDHCRQKKENILANHTVEPLPADVDKTLDKIIATARKESGTV